MRKFLQFNRYFPTRSISSQINPKLSAGKLHHNKIEKYIEYYSNQYFSDEYDFILRGKLLDSLKVNIDQLENYSSKYSEQILKLKLIKTRLEAVNRKTYLGNFYKCMMEYVETCHYILKNWNLDIEGVTGSYHINFARDFLDDLLIPGRNTRIFFSTDKVDHKYLLQIRPLCMHFIQLIPLPIFDRELLKIDSRNFVDINSYKMIVEGKILNGLEMTGHDLGHAHVMSRQDLWLFSNIKLHPINLVDGWIKTKNQYMQEIEYHNRFDPELGLAMEVALFDMVHDRGYQYYLPILKQQFEAPKNLQNLKTKIARGDFSDIITSHTLNYIDEAVKILIVLTNRFLFEENLCKEYLFDGCIIKKYLPPKNYRGVPISIKICKNDPITIDFIDSTCDRIRSSSIFEIELLSVIPDKPQYFTEEKVSLLNHLVSNSSEPVVLISETIRYKLDPILSNQLSFKLKNIEIFKLERIISLIKSQSSTNFTITSKPEIFDSKIREITNDYEIKLENGVNFFMNEIGIEPRRKNNLKYINKDPHCRFINTEFLQKSYIKYKNSPNFTADSFVKIVSRGKVYELGIVDTALYPEIAKAVSSLLTRSVDDAKDENDNAVDRGKHKYNGYVPSKFIERAQLEYVSPHGITHLWGKFGYRFVLTQKIDSTTSELVATALISISQSNLFFLTHKFNNIKIEKNKISEERVGGYSPEPCYFTGVDWDLMSECGKIKWFDKFDIPDLNVYKPEGFNQLANFAVEKIGHRGSGIGKLLVDCIIKHYAINHKDCQVIHSQPLICGNGLFQLADPSWKNFMCDIGFQVRLGAETFYLDLPEAPLEPTIINGKPIDNISYNRLFGILDEHSSVDYTDKIHIVNRIDHVKKVALSGTAKLQYYQLFKKFN